MIHTRTITESDFPAVKALWNKLHNRAEDKNCWPDAPSDAMLRRLCQTYDWTVAEEGDSKANNVNQSPNPSPQSQILGFAFWKIDTAGNASVQALAAEIESAYLHVCLAILAASRSCGYGMLQRSRLEWTWFQNIGATFQPVGFAPMTPAAEARHNSHAEKLIARQALQDKVMVPVTRIPAIHARLNELGGSK